MFRFILMCITSFGILASCSDKAPPHSTKVNTIEAQPQALSQARPQALLTPVSDTPELKETITATMAEEGKEEGKEEEQGTHLDSLYSAYTAIQSRTKKKATKSIELILRSSPPGATVSIDGKAMGNTPSYWKGPADGKMHEYTFTKNGYAMARYRFISTQNGVVHGTLSALIPTRINEQPEERKAIK